MSHVHLMSPAYYHLRIDDKELKITDSEVVFSSTNSSTYKITNTDSARREFMLIKGRKVAYYGSMTVSIIETPDKATKDSIERAKELLKKSQKESDPKEYAKTVTFIASNSSDEPLVTVSFLGYVKDIKRIAPEKEGFSTYVVTIVELDSASFKINQ